MSHQDAYYVRGMAFCIRVQVLRFTQLICDLPRKVIHLRPREHQRIVSIDIFVDVWGVATVPEPHVGVVSMACVRCGRHGRIPKKGMVLRRATEDGEAEGAQG